MHAQLLTLSAEEIEDYGLAPTPGDGYDDVNVVEGEDAFTVVGAYDGLLDDTDASRLAIERILFRRLNFIYQGGLLARFPQAPASGKDLEIMLVLGEQELPDETRLILEDYHRLCADRDIRLLVTQVPSDVF